MFSLVSVCSFGGGAAPCDHYPIALDLPWPWPRPYPLQVRSGGHHWRPVQTCPLEDFPPHPKQQCVIVCPSVYWAYYGKVLVLASAAL